ncbi:MAG: oligopeptidase A [Gammaproteobacteria bacterium]|nr:oligopeptidase A [Gammaproteobacteria bacterium]
MHNPLLDISGLPRFAAIRPEHVKPALDSLLADNRRALEQLLASVTQCSWDNFAQPIEDMKERLARMWSPVSHLNGVLNSDALRAVYNENLPRLSEYYTELAQDERLYAGYKAIAAAPDYAQLTTAQKKIIANTLRDFRLAGAELPADKKARFKDIQKELSLVTSRFSENVLDATQAWELLITNEADLAGLPDSARALAQQAAQQQGKAGWRFTLEGPSYIAFLTYADRRELRRQMYEAFVTRASEVGPYAGRWDNGELIPTILKLRTEAAALLDYPNYAEYALQTRMAKSVAEVMQFLRDLARRARPAAQQEFEELKRFAHEQHGVAALDAWDVAYYSEKLRQQRYAISQEDLRPYLPETKVVPGMFEVVRRLYGLDIRELRGVQVWHPNVRFFEIRDGVGELRGRFYMDLYARANKRGGAWMDDCISRKRSTEGVQVPVAYLVCNFSPPVNGRPALFTHDEVTTLFHEFGHGLHHMLTRVDYVGVAGINGVAWDAVELPSQFMENWCWERAALDLIAAHHETGAPLPQALYRKMIAARNFQSGMQCVRQLELALFDMRLHGDFEPAGPKTVQQLLDEVRAEVAVLFPPAYNRFQNGFTHIFAGGYAAGYYSYKWAEVLSADAFSKFEENGVFDQHTGMEFLSHVLERGGTEEPMELFVRFRGRKPTVDALLRHTGLMA